MPAQRSRTQNWRKCLSQLHERNGALEIAVARDYDDAELGSHLVWRVRLLHMSDDSLIVERPSAMGQLIPINNGTELVAVMAIGQNRWMFRCRNLGVVLHSLGSHKQVPCLRLSVPDSVDRCQRREFYRVETAALSLPDVELWPLLEPRSVLPAERANELRFSSEESEQPVEPAKGNAGGSEGSEEMLLPEVGPSFRGKLMNLGGGGLGLRVHHTESQAMQHHKLYWLRFALPPELRTPICVTAKLVHVHLDSTQHHYAGMAFDFSFNPAHQRFVVDQICRYIALQQRAQLQRQAGRHVA